MRITSEQEMLDFGKSLARRVTARQKKPLAPVVIELIGDVGAGKTTFTRGLAEGLGIKDPITSPSFTISKSYALKNGGRLIHYDFYRLQDPGLMTEDLTENLTNPKNIIVIEWGESVEDFLPNDRYIIRIDYNETGDRNLFFEESKTWASAPERSREK